MGAVLAVIRHGDRTSHGGVVLESFPDGQSDVFGIPAAGLGHTVSCPIHHGTHRIAEGVNSYTVLGTPVALHGMVTTCGATLIASQNMFSVELNETVPIAHSGSFYQDSESGEWHRAPIRVRMMNSSSFATAQGDLCQISPIEFRRRRARSLPAELTTMEGPPASRRGIDPRAFH